MTVQNCCPAYVESTLEMTPVLFSALRAKKLFTMASLEYFKSYLPTVKTQESQHGCITCTDRVITTKPTAERTV